MSGHFDQMLGIVFHCCAKPEYQVVTGLLPLRTKAADRVPDERMEPVDAHRNLGKHLCPAVPTPDMRQLVGEHKPSPVLTPRCRSSWKQDRRSKDTPGHRRNWSRTLEQLNVLPNVERLAQVRQKESPLGYVERLCAGP
jgi:hypothetical protein